MGKRFSLPFSRNKEMLTYPGQQSGEDREICNVAMGRLGVEVQGAT